LPRIKDSTFPGTARRHYVDYKAAKGQKAYRAKGVPHSQNAEKCQRKAIVQHVAVVSRSNTLLNAVHTLAVFVDSDICSAEVPSYN